MRMGQITEKCVRPAKAMEFVGLIDTPFHDELSPAAYLQKVIAVGRDVFRPDANTLVDLLKRIHNNPIRPSDTLLNHYHGPRSPESWDRILNNIYLL